MIQSMNIADNIDTCLNSHSLFVLLSKAAKVAEHCRRGVGDLTHWSAMIWGGHWRQRIGVEIARGLARCIERAAAGGRVEGSSARGRSQADQVDDEADGCLRAVCV